MSVGLVEAFLIELPKVSPKGVMTIILAEPGPPTLTVNVVES